jgi:hypothetical protein
LKAWNREKTLCRFKGWSNRNQALSSSAWVNWILQLVRPHQEHTFGHFGDGAGVVRGLGALAAHDERLRLERCRRRSRRRRRRTRRRRRRRWRREKKIV